MQRVGYALVVKNVLRHRALPAAYNLVPLSPATTTPTGSVAPWLTNRTSAAWSFSAGLTRMQMPVLAIFKPLPAGGVAICCPNLEPLQSGLRSAPLPR